MITVLFLRLIFRVGVDPKSIVCEFFKKGACRKGKKCKFSHDWSQVRRTEKIDLYADPREGTPSAPQSDAIVRFFFVASHSFDFNCVLSKKTCREFAEVACSPARKPSALVSYRPVPTARTFLLR